MSGHVPEHLIQQILSRVNLAELIGGQIKLRKIGHNFVGLCPFHTDAKPSFSINPDKGVYHCFGCHESGNAITYLTRSRGLGYREALETLAGMAGVELIYAAGDGSSERKARDKKRAMYDMNQVAQTWFRQSLVGPEGQEARLYLKGRGITDEDVARFQIGCAPGVGQSLVDYLTAKGHPMHLAEEVGLVGKRQSGGAYDKFRQRLMFPIFTTSDDVAGFSGRALAAEVQPKYLNSSESEVYKKGELLFALTQARESIKKSGFGLLVEGQIDALTLHANGYPQAIAPLGTALTDSQCHILRRLADSVVLMYDGDEAGRKATWKSMMTLLRNGVYGKVVMLPQGEDPDTFLRAKGGAEKLERLLSAARPYFEFALSTLKTQSRQTLHGRALAAQRGLEIAEVVQNDVERGVFLDQLAVELEVPRERLRGIASGNTSAPQQRAAALIPRLEMRLVEAITAHPSLVRRVVDDTTMELIQSESVRTFFGLVLEALEEHGVVDQSSLLTAIEDVQFRDVVAGCLMSPRDWKPDKAALVLEESVSGMRSEDLRKQVSVLREGIREAHTVGDLGRELDLAAKLQDIQRELSRMKTPAGATVPSSSLEV